MTKVELKFRGEELKQFILLEICSFPYPVKCTDLIFLLKNKTNVSTRTIEKILKTLLTEGEIKKFTDLQQGTSIVLYHRNF